jgi:phosphoadenosine phosphosulfate reductase
LLCTETHALLEAAKQRNGVQPIPVRPSVSLEEQARLFGDALWARDPDLCCTLRKVLPQHGLLAGFDAWITGLRRDQSATRRGVEVVEWDAQFHVIKVNPLARWTEDDVWRYMKENDVPYNALHDRGYPSIGCTHCTVPVSPGEPLRAGRWPAFRKTECGLHARSVRS